MSYTIRYAKKEDAEDILNVYQSLVGTSGCAWNVEYPVIDNVRKDIENNSLYCMTDSNRIIAVAAAGYDDELNDLTCWNDTVKNWCELARVGVRKNMQNHGLGHMLVNHIIHDVEKRGFDGIHMLVSKTNPAALALYRKLHFHCCGEAYMFNIDFFCYELVIDIAAKTKEFL
jgi:ribosomal protein S18 acetylase RimI-like enzyme